MSRLEAIKNYILTLGEGEILVINNTDGTRDYYSRSPVEESVIKNAAKDVFPSSIKFYFLDEEELAQ
jgi:hypothetical protein